MLVAPAFLPCSLVPSNALLNPSHRFIVTIDRYLNRELTFPNFQYDDTSDWGDNVDMALFDQILDMDDDEDDRTFTKGLVFGFLEQAEQTFDKMDAAVYRASWGLVSAYHITT